MKDSPGGAYVEGRLVQPLQPGLATAAIDAAGHLDVGAWGTQLDPNAEYSGLRQNLHLMVDGGVVLPGVATNAGEQWGTVKNAFPTWRSGLGITASGDIVYVAGNHLSLGVLADSLVRAGAQRAMELDIHKGMVTFNLFSHEPGIVGHKLLDDMPKPATRVPRPRLARLLHGHAGPVSETAVHPIVSPGGPTRVPSWRRAAGGWTR